MIKLHMCNVCGKLGRWRDGWSFYGSIFDEEEGTGTVLCSNECKAIASNDPESYILRVQHSRTPMTPPKILNKPTKRMEWHD